MVDFLQMRLTWKLKRYLKEHGKTPYMLSRAMEGKVRTNETALYRIADGEPVRITTEVLERILTGIQTLGIGDVGLYDLIEVER